MNEFIGEGSWFKASNWSAPAYLEMEGPAPAGVSFTEVVVS